MASNLGTALVVATDSTPTNKKRKAPESKPPPHQDVRIEKLLVQGQKMRNEQKRTELVLLEQEREISKLRASLEKKKTSESKVRKLKEKFELADREVSKQSHELAARLEELQEARRLVAALQHEIVTMAFENVKASQECEHRHKAQLLDMEAKVKLVQLASHNELSIFRSTVECGICCTDSAVITGLLCDDGHFTCNKCITTMMSLGLPSGVVCSHCSSVFEEEELIEKLSTPLVGKDEANKRVLNAVREMAQINARNEVQQTIEEVVGPLKAANDAYSKQELVELAEHSGLRRPCCNAFVTDHVDCETILCNPGCGAKYCNFCGEVFRRCDECDVDERDVNSDMDYKRNAQGLGPHEHVATCSYNPSKSIFILNKEQAVMSQCARDSRQLGQLRKALGIEHIQPHKRRIVYFDGDEEDDDDTDDDTNDDDAEEHSE